MTRSDDAPAAQSPWPPAGACRQRAAGGQQHHTVVVDGNSSGSVLTLIAADVLANKTYSFSSASGAVQITALSATSVDLLFTNVTLAPVRTETTNPATGRVILNGTVTVARA